MIARGVLPFEHLYNEEPLKEGLRCLAQAEAGPAYYNPEGERLAKARKAVQVYLVIRVKVS